jgi:superfamily II RNA helicase
VPLTARSGELHATSGDADAVLDSFVSWAEWRGISLYPAQEEAIVAVMAGENVIVNTPTGSGKSLIAVAAHLFELANGGRSFYTAPIKALVSEKFFDLCAVLGSDNVGMLTGDAAVNPGAPVICCTAEILANMALRQGVDAAVSQVVMDEFHYYADPERGWAWQVPLIELTRAQFILMSATLGDVRRFEADLIRRTGRPTTVVRSATRPVPLGYEYLHTPLHQSLDDLLKADQAPIYVVHFTQAAAVERAGALMSTNMATKAEKAATADAIGDFRFAPGFGRTTLSRLVRHGIGVHHAGMLPKYRRLVERLAQDGHLKVICGTDTLGVGINVPIRTVMFTQLSKFDGTVSRLISAREFHQIAGRAGRAGFDQAGLVVAQAPEHVIDNQQAMAKAGDDGRKRRKVVRSKAPRGFVPWDQATFDRLVGSPPEPLKSSFAVSHVMLLSVLDRAGDGCAALTRLLTDNDEPRPAQRAHIRRAVAIYRSLRAAGVVETLAEPDELGRRVRVTVDLQDDFALNQPLSPFILEVLPLLEPGSGTWALDALSVVESTLENPRQVLAAQLSRLKTEVMAELKREGMEYEDRIAVLEGLEYPKPLRELLYDNFDRYRVVHPWAADHNIAPKSVARDLYERSMGFGDYVAHYGLARSEGLVLRYLSDAYKALLQAVPEDSKSDELIDITEWLGELVRQVDSSLVDEWDQLRRPDADEAAIGRSASAGPQAPPPVSANRRAFRVMVRNEAFRRVRLLAARQWEELGELDAAAGWDSSRWETEAAPYFAEHPSMGTGAQARSPELFQLGEGRERWRLRQVLDDPDQHHEWALLCEIDLEASDLVGGPVVAPLAIARGQLDP